jgi:hypothetical protein
MLRILLSILLSAALVLPVSADICFFGYTGAITDLQRWGPGTVSFKSWLYQQKNFYAINVSAGHVFSPDDYTILRDAFPAIVNEFAIHNTKMVLDVGNIIWKFKTSGTVNCGTYGGSTSTPASSTFPKSVRRSDWLVRLNDFINTRGHLVTPSNTQLIIVHGEVNNHCIPTWQINEAAQTLRAAFPGIPLLAVYESRSDIPAALGFPPRFPLELDRIGFFAYGVYDPNDPTHPKNHTVRPFFDPNNPLSTATQWGDLVSRLRWWQKVDGTLESLYVSRQAAHGWTQTDLTAVTNNWRAWAASESRFGGILGFRWVGSAGTSDLISQGVPGLQAAHQQFANAVTPCP